jgi:hypothetical protein
MLTGSDGPAAGGVVGAISRARWGEGGQPADTERRPESLRSYRIKQ